ncbi:unnamed protein product [Caenorhabditis auriculariae]|uniref:J domain-containing protein n=1 Tax=Caenorhabditis auriculariae TaxID=2777116 RepID=A0A8S1HQZ0_9PELO|nr:unnamed protein product [Caenorhabditis auriculariae]
MTSYSSNVEDPEKHFLGNLLEDDSFSSSTPSGRGEANNVNASPTIPVVSGVGPIGGTSPTTFWPEPPPPYSPSPNESWYAPPQQQPQQPKQNPLSDFLQATLKDPADLNTFLNYEPEFFSSIRQNNSNPVQQPQIHHHHHNLHHHTHTHNVVENHHHYITPPPGLTIDTSRGLALSQQTSPSPAHSPASYSPMGRPEPHHQPHNGPRTPQRLFQRQRQNSGWKQHEHDDYLAYAALLGPQPEDVAKGRSYVNAVSAKNGGPPNTKSKSIPAPPGLVRNAIGTEMLLKHRQSAMALNPGAAAQNARIVVKGQPHSAPVVTKMPFSYRDVAAREQNHPLAQHDSPPQQIARKRSSTTNTSDGAGSVANGTVNSIIIGKGGRHNSGSSIASVGSTAKNFDGHDIEEKRLNLERKSRSDNEFQKITRKGRAPPNNKEKGGNFILIDERKTENYCSSGPQERFKMIDTTSLPVFENPAAVDSFTRYGVLQTLSPNIPIDGKSKSGRAAVITQISRSSSRCDDDEDEEEESDSEEERLSVASLSNSNTLVAASTAVSNSSSSTTSLIVGGKKELSNTSSTGSKKKQPQQVVQRRRQKRRNDPHWSEHLVNFVLLIISHVSLGVEWMLKLVVEFCSKVADVFSFYSDSFFCAIQCGCKNGVTTLIDFIKTSFQFIRKVTVTNLSRLFYMEEELPITEWGPRREVPLPNTASEIIDRLLREVASDAYAVFGLRVDCSESEIRKYYKRMHALLSPEKCSLEGAPEAHELLLRAFESINSCDKRLEYVQETAHKSKQHKLVMKCFDDLRERIEELRSTMFCDCGNRHKRVLTDIRYNEARYCRRCDMRHPAKQNDIWVERRYFGWKSVYLTCSDNQIYDISEWAQCEKSGFLEKPLTTSCFQYRPRQAAPRQPQRRTLFFSLIDYLILTSFPIFPQYFTFEKRPQWIFSRNMLKNMRPHTHAVQYRLINPPTGMGSDGGDHFGGGGGGGYGNPSNTGGTPLNSAGERLMSDMVDEFNLLRQQRGFAQITFKPSEPRDEDRNRRAANRRQKKWRC